MDLLCLNGCLLFIWFVCLTVVIVLLMLCISFALSSFSVLRLRACV